MNNLFSEDYLIESPDYASVMNNVVIPGLEKYQQDQILSGKDGLSLFCSVFNAENPRGTVMILHGFTENAYKYSELIWSLIHNHFSVVAYDQRGHGRSGRSDGLADPSVTHVDRFEDYVDDLQIVCDKLLVNLPQPWLLFAHSMGGAVASLFIEKDHNTFSAVSLCAPMIAPNTGGIPAPVASAVCHAAILLGCGKHHPFFMKPYSGPESFETSCAADPVRFAWYDAVKASRKDFWNSVPTYRWTSESIGVTKKILSAGAPESINCPVLLSTADKDFSVLPLPQEKLIQRIPKGRQIFVKDSRHEIFRSQNSVFFPWWHEILLFLKEAHS